MAKIDARIQKISRIQVKAACEICGQGPTTGTVYVETDPMRDNDERNVCLQCLRIYSKQGLLYMLEYIERNQV